VIDQLVRRNLPQSIRDRTKIILPEPQISDQEISEIGKQVVPKDDDEGIEATKLLVSNYMPTPSLQTPGQGQSYITDRTPLMPDTIMLEAQKLKALTTQSTPLLPSENDDIPEFTGPTPGNTNIKTPNPLLLRLRTPMQNTDNMTPGGVMGTPRKTPFRDQFNINTENDIQTRLKLKEEKEKLKQGLTSLPDPKREIQIVVPELPEDFDNMDIDKGSSSNLQDESEKDRLLNLQRQAKKDAQLRLRSQVLRRNLPRPFKVNTNFAKSENEIEELKNTSPDDYIPELLKSELSKMMINDSLTYPTKNNLPTKISKKTWNYEQFTEDELKNAKLLLQKETQSLMEENEQVSFDDFQSTWIRCQEELIYLPHKKKFNLFSNSMSQNDKIPALEYQFETIEKDLQRQEKKAILGEKKLHLYHGGYVKVSSKLEGEIVDLYHKINQSYVDLQCFKELLESELDAIPKRIEESRGNLERVKSIENELQVKYMNLLNRKNELSQISQQKKKQSE